MVEDATTSRHHWWVGYHIAGTRSNLTQHCKVLDSALVTESCVIHGYLNEFEGVEVENLTQAKRPNLHGGDLLCLFLSFCTWFVLFHFVTFPSNFQSCVVCSVPECECVHAVCVFVCTCERG